MTALVNSRVAPEYDCYPLWTWRQDDLENLAPDSLPVSPELRKDIELWDADYQATYATEYPPDSGFATSAEEADFAARGEKLARRLKRELGATVEVTYRDLRSLGRVRITE